LPGARLRQQLPQYKVQRARRDNQARRGRPEIPAKTQTGIERMNKSVWMRKNVPMTKNEAMTKGAAMTEDNAAMTKDALTKRPKNVKTLVVRRESTFIQIPTEERFASGTRRLS
jgi:hypothetical protein